MKKDLIKKFPKGENKMKKNILRAVALIMIVVMMTASFAGCSTSDVERPVAATIKTDLNDVTFVFTYGQLKNVLPSDQLAALFENTNKKTDDKTVSLSYYEIVSKYGDKDYFKDVISLISAEDMAKFTNNQQAVLDYFNGLINNIKSTGSARVSYSESFWIDHGGEVLFLDADGKELDGQGELRAAFRIFADTSLKDIGKYLMNKSQEESTEYGANLTDVIYPLGSSTASTLTLSDLYTETNEETNLVTQPIYSSVVPTLEFDLDEDGNNAEDETGEYIFVPTEYLRVINIAVNPTQESVTKAFSVREKEAITEEFKVTENYLKLNSFEIGFNPCKITAGINAENDRMTYVTYDKNMVITANVTFTGSLAKYGTVTVVFPCTSSLTYNFGWPTEEAE